MGLPRPQREALAFVVWVTWTVSLLLKWHPRSGRLSYSLYSVQDPGLDSGATHTLRGPSSHLSQPGLSQVTPDPVNNQYY